MMRKIFNRRKSLKTESVEDPRKLLLSLVDFGTLDVDELLLACVSEMSDAECKRVLNSLSLPQRDLEDEECEDGECDDEDEDLIDDEDCEDGECEDEPVEDDLEVAEDGLLDEVPEDDLEDEEELDLDKTEERIRKIERALSNCSKRRKCKRRTR